MSASIARVVNILTLKVLETRTTIVRALIAIDSYNNLTTIARASIANTNIIINLYGLLSSIKVFESIEIFISNSFFSRTFDFLNIKESLATFSLRLLL